MTDTDHENATKAAQTADLLCRDLVELTGSSSDRCLTELADLLLSQAVQIRSRLERITQ